MPSWEMRYSAEGLAARAEIEDIIQLYFHAVDRRRWELLARVFHDDATAFIAGMGGGWREFVAEFTQLFAAHLEFTQHHLGNLLIGFEGDQASTETYCIAYHRVRADAPRTGIFSGTGESYDFIGGLRYADRFERRAGQWRIAERRGIPEWRHIRAATEKPLVPPPGFRGIHGPEDPCAGAVAGWAR